VSGPYGFGLTIYSFGKKLLIAISSKQFPFPSAKRGFDGQRETINRLSELTHSRQNIEILVALHLEPQNPDPQSYTY